MSYKSVSQILLGGDWDNLGNIIQRHYFLNKNKMIVFVCLVKCQKHTILKLQKLSRVSLMRIQKLEQYYDRNFFAG